MFVKLKYLNGTHPGSTKQFSQPIIRVGRAPSCDFALYDSSGRHSVASRAHAELRCEANELFVYDLNSSNGTFLNEVRVMRSPLKNGDALSFGPDGLQLQVNFLISSKDEVEFLSSCPLFQELTWKTLQEVIQHGEIKQYPAGSYLFRIGEECNFIYVIFSGLIEISAVRDASGRPTVVDFLSSGESLGESLALINGKHRSEARVAEDAEIFVLSTETLKQLLQDNPEFAVKFSSLLCQRLNASESQLQSRRNSRKLQGDVHHFDLATIVQTLNNLRDIGVLSLYPKTDDDSDGAGAIGAIPPFARIYFEAGEIRYIKFGLRSSEEAFYQLFQMPLAGTFSFELEDLSEDLADTAPIRMPTMNLLLEAHRLQDEIQNLRQELPDLTTTFKIEKDSLDWPDSDEDRKRYAEQIWGLIEKKAPLCELLGKADCCNYTTYKVLTSLLQTGQISADRSVKEEPALRQTTVKMEPMFENNRK
ncbi:MAG: FHA domain-containing protein [Blastocatellia bacterium]|nr:FHA domain-containing protein [Blastocatellia bacterium]